MRELPESIDLEFLLDAHIDLAPAENVGATPFGTRSIFVVTGGAFEGPRLRGTLRPGGGDWLLTLPNGAAELDVRITLETDDGARILVTYRGVLDASPAVLARIFGGEDVSPSEYYFRATPRFETGSEKYAWLNKLVCVAAGRPAPGTVSYRAVK
jgi:hypothetical protein